MPSSNQQLSVSVIIPVHNGGEIFRRCLSSIVAAVPPPHEVIVVADGDTDGSWSVAQEYYVKVLRIPVCSGPAKARNVGAQAATGDILFFVDADVTIYPDTIRQVAIAFQCEPELAALIGSYDDAPGAQNFLSQYKNLLHHYVHQTAREDASTFWGACGAIRREVFFAVGGFDNSYRRPTIEDIELGYRLKQAGYTIRLCKSLQVKHLKRWGVISLLRADFFYRALPWTELILRDRQPLNDLNLQFSSRLSVVLIFAMLGVAIGSVWWTKLLGVVVLLGGLLLILNAPVYQFFVRQRGWWFALRVIPWHWLYYFYCGLAYAIGTGRHYWRQNKRFAVSQTS